MRRGGDEPEWPGPHPGTGYDDHLHSFEVYTLEGATFSACQVCGWPEGGVWPVSPRLYHVALRCGCEVDVWRLLPYPGELRCGFADHDHGPAEWTALPGVLIPATLAEDSAAAMHMLRLFAEDQWSYDEAAQVSALGPYPFVQDEVMGWWERRPSRTDEARLYWIGRVAPS